MRYIFSILLIIGCFSCTKEPLLSDQARHDLWLLHDGADIPIVVEGNTNSKVFVLLLHGGPGGSAQDFNAGSQPFTDVLEKEYAMVYYDQRNAGLARGEWDIDKLTIAKHVEDLDKVIELIKARFGPDLRIILAGHSWGAYLGTAYILDQQRSNKVRTLINIDGLIHRNLRNIHSMDRITEIANDQISENINTENWSNLLSEVTLEQDKNITQYSVETEDPVFDLKNRAEQLIDQDRLLRFNSSSEIGSIYRDNYDPFLILINDRNGTLPEQMYEFDKIIDTTLAQITLPVLSVYGKYDTNTPIQQAEYLHEKIGSDPEDKKIIMLNFSGHSSMNNEPLLLAEEIKDWIEQYR